MVRQGRGVARGALLLALAAVSGADARQAPKPAPAGPPIEMRPYRIRAFVSFDPSARVDAALRDVAVEDWLKLAGRFVGGAWDVEVGDSDGPAGLAALDDLTPAAARGFAGNADKVWFVRGRAEGSGLLLSGREFDAATGWLGTRHEVSCLWTDDLARSMLRLSLGLFAPLAEIGEQRGGGVTIRVQGAAIKSPDPIGEPAPLGAVFTPVRVFLDSDGSPVEVVRVPYSYLRVVRLDGTQIHCEIVRGVRDPLTKRVIRRNKLIALGVRPSAAATRLRFVHDGTKVPAAGYTLTSRPYPTGPSREVGTTDRDGRIVLPPGFAPGLVRLRLVAGKAEPMADVPLMPGETVEERTIPFVPRPLTIALEARLDALRDSIVDDVAVRSRLERRLKARVESDSPDWDDVEASLKEFRKLPTKSAHVARLKAIEEETKAAETKTKTLILTRNALSQVKDTEALIERYLDDEIFEAYADALNRARGIAARPAPKPIAAPPPPPPTSEAARPPAAAPKPAPAAPRTKAAPSGVTPF